MRSLLLLIIAGTLFSCAQIQQLADKYQKEVQKQKMEREKKEREQQQSQQTVTITEGSSSSSCTQSTSSTQSSSCTQNSSTQNTPVHKAASFVTTLSQQEIQEYLDFHNKARKEVGVPPVQWSDEIAAYSQEWADYLAQNNRFEHRSDNRYGENIAMHYDNALVNGAKLWYQEKKHYKGAVPPRPPAAAARRFTARRSRGPSRRRGPGAPASRRRWRRRGAHRARGVRGRRPAVARARPRRR
jgi:uncharacterized protein YkwD